MYRKIIGLGRTWRIFLPTEAPKAGAAGTEWPVAFVCLELFPVTVWVFMVTCEAAAASQALGWELGIRPGTERASSHLVAPVVTGGGADLEAGGPCGR